MMNRVFKPLFLLSLFVSASSELSAEVLASIEILEPIRIVGRYEELVFHATFSNHPTSDGPLVTDALLKLSFDSGSLFEFGNGEGNPYELIAWEFDTSLINPLQPGESVTVPLVKLVPDSVPVSPGIYFAEIKSFAYDSNFLADIEIPIDTEIRVTVVPVPLSSCLMIQLCLLVCSRGTAMCMR